MLTQTKTTSKIKAGGESRLRFAAAGPTLSEFLRRRDHVQTLIGPLGCMRAGTLIQTDEGLVRIDQVVPGMRVLSWDDEYGRFRYVPSAGSHPKGTDCLYRISTQQGEFVAAGHHRVRLSSGEYQCVSDVSVGACLSASAQPPRLNASVFRVLQRYARRYWRTAAGCLSRYAGSARLHGLRPLQAQGIGLVPPQSAIGAAESCLSFDQGERRLVDAPLALTHTRSLAGICDDQKGTQGYFHRIDRPYGHRACASVVCALKPCFSRYFEAIRGYLRSPAWFDCRRTVVVVLQRLLSFASLRSRTAQRTVNSITRLDEAEVYWDMEVPRTRNYVTADGTVHHNSAKTTTTITKLISLWEKAPVDPSDGVRRSRWAAVRNTYPDLTTTTIKDFMEVIEPLKVGTLKMGAPPTFTAKFLASDGVVTEAEVFFLAFDLPQDVNKARGLRLSGCWFNEMKELSKANVDMVMSRVGRYRPDLLRKNPECWYGALGDSNAPDSDHWLAKLSRNPPKGWWFGIQPGAVFMRSGQFVVNPAAENLQNLAPGYYERMMEGKDEYWIRQNLGNEFVFYSDGRAVHPSFNQRVHVAQYELESTPGIDLTLGFDFGRTPAGVVMQRQHNGQWWVLDEMVTANTSARPFAKTFVREILNKKYEGYEYTSTGDPSGGSGGQATDDTPLEMMAEGGIDTFPAYTNDFDVRADTLDRLLTELIDGEPAILISPRCTTLIRGLSGAYQFKRVQVSGMDRYHDKPEKSPESHVCEALHYGLMGDGEGGVMVSEAWQKDYDLVESEYGGWHLPHSHFE